MSAVPPSGAGATTAQTGSPQDHKEKVRAASSQARWSWMLVGPTLVVLAIVIVYPITSAVFQSFQKDSGLDKATGMFVAGGFAGFSNYTHWLLQQCTTAGGATVPCPPRRLRRPGLGSGGGGVFFSPVFGVAVG